MPTPTPIVIDGIEYRSIRAAAKAANLNQSTVLLRKRRGFTPEELLSPLRTVAKPIVVKGRTYPSVTAAAKAFGVNLGVVRQRLRAGWSADKTFTTPIKKQGKPSREG